MLQHRSGLAAAPFPAQLRSLCCTFQAGFHIVSAILLLCQADYHLTGQLRHAGQCKVRIAQIFIGSLQFLQRRLLRAKHRICLFQCLFEFFPALRLAILLHGQFFCIFHQLIQINQCLERLMLLFDIIDQPMEFIVRVVSGGHCLMVNPDAAAAHRRQETIQLCL